MSRRIRVGLLVLGLVVLLVVMPLVLLKQNASTPADRPAEIRRFFRIGDARVLEPGGGGGFCLAGETRDHCRKRFAER